jgi:hypothetical protein
MRKILFLFLWLPISIYAQTAKDTVNVLTDSEISTGTPNDTIKFYFIENTWKKVRLDTLAKYTRVKLIGNKGDVTVSGSEGETWTINNAAVTTAKLAADAVDSTKVIAGGLAGSDLADNAVTGAKIAATTVTGNKLAITGISGDAAHLVGAISGGNADTVRVGSGLQLSSGELRADTAAMIIACSDELTAITTGDGKVTFRVPFNITIIGVASSLNTSSSSGLPTVDITASGNSIFSTNKLSINVNELTSYTATTPATLDSTRVNIARDTEMKININVAGTGAKGLKVTILYRKN